MSNRQETAETLGRLIDTVEDWLDSKGITPEMIDNEDREGNDDEAIIFGSDYDLLADKFAQVLGLNR